MHTYLILNIDDDKLNKPFTKSISFSRAISVTFQSFFFVDGHNNLLTTRHSIFS